MSSHPRLKIRPRLRVDLFRSHEMEDVFKSLRDMMQKHAGVYESGIG